MMDRYVDGCLKILDGFRDLDVQVEHVADRPPLRRPHHEARSAIAKEHPTQDALGLGQKHPRPVTTGEVVVHSVRLELNADGPTDRAVEGGRLALRRRRRGQSEERRELDPDELDDLIAHLILDLNLFPVTEQRP